MICLIRRKNKNIQLITILLTDTNNTVIDGWVNISPEKKKNIQILAAVQS